MLAFPDFGSGESNIVGTIREVFTCTHHFSSLSAVAGFTKAMNCHLGMGLGTGNRNPETFGTQILWLWIITAAMTPPLNLQLHFLVNSSLIQPFRRQQSMLPGCYSSEQWVLGLVTETGVDEEIGLFSQFQKDDS